MALFFCADEKALAIFKRGELSELALSSPIITVYWESRIPAFAGTTLTCLSLFIPLIIILV
jgi:hypothetical protein